MSSTRSCPSRGEVWLINLDPTVGNEIQRTPPCVVVSPPEINDDLSVMIVAPLTSGSRAAPFRVAPNVRGKPGLMLLGQIRAVDARRLIKKIGKIDRLTLNPSLAGLRSLFAE